MSRELRPPGGGVLSEDEDDDEGEDDEHFSGGQEDEDGKVQRKLHLFQSLSVQQSIKRLWDLLPKDENGELLMEGYVELNLRLQKCLTQEFILERAIDSAIGDWGEDVHEGHRSMSAEEFAMFLFELSSLWCGPSVCLLVYLLFLNATFIAVTDARGAHTVGLKPLTAVERLPQPFFDLLSVQGWARQPEDGAGLDEDQALESWFVRNLSPESEQATRLQVQRQVFQVTHDVRAVLLFQEGEKNGEGVLDLVKLASKRLVKVAPIDADALGKSVATATGMPSTAPARPVRDLCSQPWCPAMHDRPPQGYLPPDPQSPLRRASNRQTPAQRRASSQPSKGGLGRQPGEHTISDLLAIGDWKPRRQQANSTASDQAGPPPKGRAFDTRLTRAPASGLVLAGQATMLAAASAQTPSSEVESVPGRVIRDSVGNLRSSTAGTRGLPDEFFEGASSPEMAESSASASQGPAHGAPSPVSDESSRDAKALDAARELARKAFSGPSGKISRGPTPPSGTPLIQSAAPSRKVSKAPETIMEADPCGGWKEDPEQVQLAASSLMDIPAAPPYKLPRHPTELYHQQTDPLLKLHPQSIVFACQQWQSRNPLVDAPFDRVLRQLPPDVRPSSAGPTVGPMKHPNEPIWFEMVHRLHGILKRQGRRADRKRKRRLKSKLFRGRARNAPQKRDEGKELREYLDRHKAESQAQPLPTQPGVGAGVQNPGEFFGKVQERYLINRDRIESRPFRVRGAGSAFAGKKGVGEIIERKHGVVRPVYVPPPPSSMAGR